HAARVRLQRTRAACAPRGGTTHMKETMLGAYGDWASAHLGEGPARLSFRQPRFRAQDINRWRSEARQRLNDCLLMLASSGAPKVEVQHQFEFDGLHIEHLQWQLPYGPATEAIFLKPAGARERLPAVLGLHDHGGNKYFGHRKISRMSQDMHPLMKRHQEHYYGGAAWANELARRGYAVLVHDAFLFGSRRIRLADVPEVLKRNLSEVTEETETLIAAYNTWAAQQETVVAKSLFCAGLTWPGVFLWEDQRALDYLCARPDVDAKRVGCAGLSGGGLRTVFLAGSDDRIAASVCVGMMTTWRDYLLNKSHTHTWMCYVPQLPRDLDYPEILGLRVPLPALVLNDSEDQLFTLPEMQRADRMLRDVYRKANAADRYHCSFYPGPHKFDLAMQKEAFEWFDRWLKT
ncbi:MAG: alpha/beta hydrolase family protein, partial [Blastocatellia bacterium]